MTALFVLSLALLWVLVVSNTLMLMALARNGTPGAAAAASTEGSGLSVAPTAEAGQSDLQGREAPAFRIEDLEGTVITRGSLGGSPAALLFVSPDCSTCGVTLHELEALQGKVNGNVVVICRSVGQNCAEMAKTYGLGGSIVSDADLAISRLFHISITPTAVLLDADGRIESYGRPSSPNDLRDSLRRAGWDQPRAGHNHREDTLPVLEVNQTRG